MALTIKDFRLGRIDFPTIEEGFKEAVGDALEAVGAGLVAGERKPRPFDLALPVRPSSAEPNPYVEAERMRRQVRSLMENAAARLSGLYIKVAFDPEQNGWLLVGGGDLEYAEGGLAFSDYKLSFSDSYVVGRRRTHRPARRIMATDRRLITTPRDIERLVYSSAFAGTPAVARVALPHGATDARARNIVSASITQTLPTADGGSAILANNLSNGDVVSFEQPESAEGLGDVTILDRRGNKAPAEVMATKEPQATFGWEEVYGPDYPLSEGDIPTLQNGLCRLRYVTQGTALCIAIDQFEAGAWVERSRVVPYADNYAESLVFAQVKEWTPDRAVVFFRAKTPSSNIDVYMILQRGWTGPRFEAYCRPTAGSVNAPHLWYFPADSNEMLYVNQTTIKFSTENWTTSLGFMPENMEPWAVLMPVAGGGIAHSFAPSAPLADTLPANSSVGFGSARKSLRFKGTTPSATATGWIGMDFRLGGSEAPRIFEAETHRNTASVTTSQVADGTASAGQAVEETQAAETNPTLLEPLGGTAIGLVGLSSYAIWVRVRVVTAGATASVRAAFGGTIGSIKTTNSTTFVWLLLGTIVKPTASTRFQLNEWRSAGTGNTRVDRVVCVPLEAAAEDGLIDLAQTSLYDARGIAELVTR